jgi:hypothetical protein
MKRCGRDEPIQVVIYLLMEATQGISLYSYPYLKLAKSYVFLITSYVFSSTKFEKKTEQVLPGSKGVGGRRTGGGVQGGEMTETMYTHMNKCINNKKKELGIQSIFIPNEKSITVLLKCHLNTSM